MRANTQWAVLEYLCRERPVSERFAILLSPVFDEHDPRGELAIDPATGMPATYTHRRSAVRAMLASLPDYLASSARIVRVKVDMSTDVPTFEVYR